MLTAPEVVSEVERSNEARESWNSCTASVEMFEVVVPTVSSVTSMPSIWTRVAVPELALTVTAR